jgi:O-antigen/teichoic acid export membrane protein
MNAPPVPPPRPAITARIAAGLKSPALFAYGLKGANALAAFLATALLARSAGPAIVGDYSFSVVTATLLGVIALHGLDVVSLREIAGDLRQGATGAARGVQRFVTISIAIVTIAMTLLFVAVAGPGPLARLLDTNHDSLLAGAVGIATVSFYRLGLANIRAAGRPVAGQFFEGLNSFFFAGLIALMWKLGQPTSAPQAVLLFFGCQFASVVLMWIIVRRDSRPWALALPVDAQRLRSSGFPIMAIQGLQMFSDWLLFVLIAGVGSAAAVGAMRVAMQVVLVMTLVVTTGENFLAARVAGDLRAGRPDIVWRRHRRATLLMALVVGPMILVCLVVPGQLLGLAFGQPFAVAGPALAIMSIGQATKVASGPIGALLTMSGHERWLLRITIAGVAIMVGISLWLVPILGLEGAAIAQAATVSFRNIASYVAAWWLIPKVPQPQG